MSRLLLICGLLALVSAPSSAQTAASPQKPSSGSNCRPTAPANAKGHGSQTCPTASDSSSTTAADRFPYPGESRPTSPDPAAAKQVPASTGAANFPYPGDAVSSSSSSTRDSSSDADTSSSSSSRASDSGVSPAGDAESVRSVRHKLPKPERMQTDEDRESEDLTVAKFYRQSGNLRAAYLRSKDAVAMQPDDPEAHFALADAAQHLNKREEAAAEYNAYLKLDPDGDRVKFARKALSKLK